GGSRWLLLPVWLVGGIMSFEAVFAEIAGEDALSVRIFEPSLGELDASSEGAAAAVSVAHLLGLLPVACALRVKMRGGTLFVRADYLGAPISVAAEVQHCVDGRTEI
ncbi:MAG: hypothetical protein IKM52_03655, partial [Clostridia bacterium]|nr:hypothetical protein [Clostridia bacterium]